MSKLGRFFDALHHNMDSDTVDEYTGKFSIDFTVWLLSKLLIPIIVVSTLSLIVGLILLFIIAAGDIKFSQVWWVYLMNLPTIAFGILMIRTEIHFLKETYEKTK